MSAKTYQVGAHFEALIEGVLMASLKTFARFFFAFQVFLLDCVKDPVGEFVARFCLI